MKEFYVGQDVVAVRNHSSQVFAEGDTFVIKSLSINCKCGLLIDVGILDDLNRTHKFAICTCCNSEVPNDGIWWFGHICFRPLDELTNISELTEILENTKPFEINK